MSDLARPAPPDVTRAEPLRPDASLGDLVGQMTSDIGLLVRKEFELAQLEVKEEISKTAKAGGVIGGGVIAGWMALLLLSFAAAWGLAEVMATGLAFFIVGVIYAGVAAVLITTGKSRLKSVNPKPEQTIDSIKENAEWTRTRVQSR